MVLSFTCQCFIVTSKFECVLKLAHVYIFLLKLMNLSSELHYPTDPVQQHFLLTQVISYLNNAFDTAYWNTHIQVYIRAVYAVKFITSHYQYKHCNAYKVFKPKFLMFIKLILTHICYWMFL